MIRTLIATGLLAMAATPAMAGTATDTFEVKLKVTAACSVTAHDLDFGTHASAATANVDVNSDIVVKCTKNTPYTVALSAGTTAGNTVDARKMAAQTASNTDTVPYALYSDAGRTNNWGEVGSGAVGGTGTGADQTLTVYGRVLAADLNVTADDYKDVVTATVTY